MRISSKILAILVLFVFVSKDLRADIPLEVRKQLRSDVRDAMESSGSHPGDDAVDEAMKELESLPKVFEFSKKELEAFSKSLFAPSDQEISKGFGELKAAGDGIELPGLLVYYSGKHSEGALSSKQKVLCARLINATLASLLKALGG